LAVALWLPAAGLVHEAHKGAQLRLAADGMMEAQIVGAVRHQGIERGIAEEGRAAWQPSRQT
jgi:hypothetical protein